MPLCLCGISPLLADGVRKYLLHLLVQQRLLLAPCQPVSELYLQAVSLAVLCLQVLDGTDAAQLTRHHDGHAVAHSLRLLHVVGGEDGAALVVLERSPYGSPGKE